jgi:hypothetical protein
MTSPTQIPLPDHTHNIHKRQKAKTSARFEPAIPASERLQAHALDSAATGIGKLLPSNANIKLGVNMINYGSSNVLVSAIGQEVSLPHYVVPFIFFTPETDT